MSKLQFHLKQFQSFDRDCLCSSVSLAHSLVRCVFGICHVNIKLHQSTHCRIFMFQTWSLCYIAVHVFRSMSIKPMWFWINFLHRFSMRTKKKRFIEKFGFYFVCHRHKFYSIGSLTSSIQSTFCFIWFDYFFFQWAGLIVIHSCNILLSSSPHLTIHKGQ